MAGNTPDPSNSQYGREPRKRRARRSRPKNPQIVSPQGRAGSPSTPPPMESSHIENCCTSTAPTELAQERGKVGRFRPGEPWRLSGVWTWQSLAKQGRAARPLAAAPAPRGATTNLICMSSIVILRLPDLGRFSKSYPGNGLGTFPSDFLHPGRADSTPVPTRLRRVAHSNGFAVRPGIRTVVCLAAIACRQRATRRSRVGTLPQADTAGGSRSKSAISISAEVRKSEF